MALSWMTIAPSFGELQYHFCVIMPSQLENMWVLSCWYLLDRKLHRLLVLENSSNQLQRLWKHQLREISLVVVAGSGIQARPKNLLSNSVRCHEKFLNSFTKNHVKPFSLKKFDGCFWNFGARVLLIDDASLPTNRKFFPLPLLIKVEKDSKIKWLGTVMLI